MIITLLCLHDFNQFNYIIFTNVYSKHPNNCALMWKPFASTSNFTYFYERRILVISVFSLADKQVWLCMYIWVKSFFYKNIFVMYKMTRWISYSVNTIPTLNFMNFHNFHGFSRIFPKVCTRTHWTLTGFWQKFAIFNSKREEYVGFPAQKAIRTLFVRAFCSELKLWKISNERIFYSD